MNPSQFMFISLLLTAILTLAVYIATHLPK